MYKRKIVSIKPNSLEALFYEDSNNDLLPESSAEADQLPIEAFVVRDCDSDEPCDEDDDDYDEVCEDKPRTMDEIYEAIETLKKQIWYNRHMNRRWQIEVGEVYPERQNYILDEISAGALKYAKKVEDELGKENLGPWTDFEWGMLNGRLLELRWAVGNEDLYLDT